MERKARIIAIGDGLKLIRVPSQFFVENQDEETVRFFIPGVDGIIGRISALSIVSQGRQIDISGDLKEGAAIRKATVIRSGGVLYYQYSDKSMEHDTVLFHHHFFAGINNHEVILTVTVEESRSDSAEVRIFLDMIPEMIVSICDETDSECILSDIPDDSMRLIKERIGRFTARWSVRGKLQIGDFENCVRTLPYTEETKPQWCDMGFAFGAFLIQQLPSFQWSFFRDKIGLDYCIRFKDTGILVFPVGLFAKRKEEETDFSVREVFDGLLAYVRDETK